MRWWKEGKRGWEKEESRSQSSRKGRGSLFNFSGNCLCSSRPGWHNSGRHYETIGSTRTWQSNRGSIKARFCAHLESGAGSASLLARIERWLKVQWRRDRRMCVGGSISDLLLHINKQPHPYCLAVSLVFCQGWSEGRACPTEVNNRFTSLSIGLDSCLSEDSKTERDERWQRGWDGGLWWPRSHNYEDFTLARRQRQLLRLSDMDVTSRSQRVKDRHEDPRTGERKEGTSDKWKTRQIWSLVWQRLRE